MRCLTDKYLAPSYCFGVTDSNESRLRVSKVVPVKTQFLFILGLVFLLSVIVITLILYHNHSHRVGR